MRARRVRDGDVRSKVLAQYASLLQKHGELDAAREKAQQSIDAAVAARYPTARVDALATAMTIHAKQRRTDDAKRYGFEAAEAIESIHSHLDAERLGPAWSSRTQDIYVKLATIMLDDYRSQQQPDALASALDVMERSRAISLRQQFSAPTNVTRQVEQSQVLSTLSEIANEQAHQETNGGELSLAYYHAHDLLTLSRLAGVGDVPVPRPLDVREIQRSLTPQRIVLYYFFSMDRAYLLLMTQTSLELLDLGGRQHVEALVTDVRKAIAVRGERLVAALRALSTVILPTRLSATKEWIVVGDGSLHGVPFSALHVGTADGNYTPAISRYSVRIVPSLSAYLMRKPVRDAQHSVDLAVFADPIFGFRGRRGTDGGDEAAKQFVGWTETLSRLPSTAREAEQLKKLFLPNRTLVYTGGNATRENLRSVRARDARVLHVASHGYFRSSSPDNIGFALAAVGAGGRELDSGFVTLTELFTYRFNNELVVISGCDTAMGPERGGEGMMSLTRGFIAQGAAHVVSTLWAVSDRASADFMTLFYAHLVRHGSVAEALRAAQDELRSSQSFRDPFFWAPYVLTTVEPDDRMSFGDRTISTAANR